MPPPFFSNEAPLQVHSRSASSSTCCGLSPDIVVIKLRTTVVIPDYNLYYTTPIDSFEPPYHALADGSLIATPFIVDLRNANLVLVLLSAAAAFFAINTLWAITFLRRGNIKNKTLLYALLTSQAVGIPAMVSLVATYFDQFANCTTISIFVKTCTGVSHSLLVTGILGYKAYRCLNSSRLVLAALSVLRAILIGLLVANMVKSRVSRRLSGSCFPSGSLGLMPYLIIVQTIEAAFICACFLYAVRKNAKSARYQGRISIQTLSDGLRGLMTAGGAGNLDPDAEGSRGWWDYVPEVSHAQQETHTAQPHNSSHNLSSAVQFVGNDLLKPGDLPTDLASRSISRKTSTRTASAPVPSLRTLSMSLSVSQANSTPLQRDLRTQNGYRPLSGASSVMSRLSKYISRMQTFRQMLTNELYYTALLTVIFLAMAIVMLVGSNQRWLMTSIGWICLDWVFVSAFTMQSFRRVVRNHEREALLQSAAAWSPIYRAGSKAHRIIDRHRFPDRPLSPVAIVPYRRDRALSDPFADFVSTEPGFVPSVVLVPESVAGYLRASFEPSLLARSRQGSSSSTSSSEASVYYSEDASPEVDPAAYHGHQGIENPFDSIYEVV